MTNAKVLVPKEVAEAIEGLRLKKVAYPNNDKLLIAHAETLMGRGKWVLAASVLNDVPMEIFARAVINGYEVEKSPGDKVREYYARNSNEYASTPYTTNLFEGRRQGIVETLNLLEIKIGGVNA